jgi:hypothetical protein
MPRTDKNLSRSFQVVERLSSVSLQIEYRQIFHNTFVWSLSTNNETVLLKVY